MVDPILRPLEEDKEPVDVKSPAETLDPKTAEPHTEIPDPIVTDCSTDNSEIDSIDASPLIESVEPTASALEDDMRPPTTAQP